jgi:L-ascorbate metabolism protein UlaG (beta-lactamase superfamily)
MKDFPHRPPMKITKYGHSCFLLEHTDVRILVDPGSYSTGQNEIKNIDMVFVSHEHSDHVDLESITKIIANNPEARIVTTPHVSEDMRIEGIVSEKATEGDIISLGEIKIEIVGKTHAYMHSSLEPCQNIGFQIEDKFFYPGDTLSYPKGQIDILALPVAGPWLKLSEAVDYALEVKPKICFPVHDGILKKIGSTNEIPPRILGPAGIKFEILEIGKEHIF